MCGFTVMKSMVSPFFDFYHCLWKMAGNNRHECNLAIEEANFL